MALQIRGNNQRYQICQAIWLIWILTLAKAAPQGSVLSPQAANADVEDKSIPSNYGVPIDPIRNIATSKDQSPLRSIFISSREDGSKKWTSVELDDIPVVLLSPKTQDGSVRSTNPLMVEAAIVLESEEDNLTEELGSQEIILSTQNRGSDFNSQTRASNDAINTNSVSSGRFFRARDDRTIPAQQGILLERGVNIEPTLIVTQGNEHASLGERGIPLTDNIHQLHSFDRELNQFGENTGAQPGTSRSSFIITTDDHDDILEFDNLSTEDDASSREIVVSLGRRFHPLGIPLRSGRIGIQRKSAEPRSSPNINDPFILPPNAVFMLDDSEEDLFDDDIDVVVNLSPRIEAINHDTSAERLSLSDDFLNQYNFVDVKGITKWGYKTEDQYQDHKVNEDGTMEGKFGWVAPGGSRVDIEYIADENGYRVLSSSGRYIKDEESVQKERERHLLEHKRVLDAISATKEKKGRKIDIPIPNINSNNSSMVTLSIDKPDEFGLPLPVIIDHHHSKSNPSRENSDVNVDKGKTDDSLIPDRGDSLAKSNDFGIPLPPFNLDSKAQNIERISAVPSLLERGLLRSHSGFVVIPNDDDDFPVLQRLGKSMRSFASSNRIKTAASFDNSQNKKISKISESDFLPSKFIFGAPLPQSDLTEHITDDPKTEHTTSSADVTPVNNDVSISTSADIAVSKTLTSELTRSEDKTSTDSNSETLQETNKFRFSLTQPIFIIPIEYTDDQTNITNDFTIPIPIRKQILNTTNDSAMNHSSEFITSLTDLMTTQGVPLISDSTDMMNLVGVNVTHSQSKEFESNHFLVVVEEEDQETNNMAPLSRSKLPNGPSRTLADILNFLRKS